MTTILEVPDYMKGEKIIEFKLGNRGTVRIMNENDNAVENWIVIKNVVEIFFEQTKHEEEIENK